MNPFDDPNASLYKVPEEFLDLSEAVFRLVVVHDTARVNAVAPYARRSRAAADFENQETYSSAASARPVEELHAEAGAYLARADDHLRALAGAIAAERTAHSVLSLARVVLASSAYAYSMLDPAIDTKARIARSFNFQLRSLYEFQQVVADRDPELEAATTARIDALLETAPMLETKLQTGGRRRVHLAPIEPGERDLVVGLIERRPARPAKGKPMGPGSTVYSILSASVHSQMLVRGLSNLIDLPRRVPDIPRTGEEVTIGMLARVTAYAYAGYCTAHERHREYFAQPKPSKIRQVKRDAQLIAHQARSK